MRSKMVCGQCECSLLCMVCACVFNNVINVIVCVCHEMIALRPTKIKLRLICSQQHDMEFQSRTRNEETATGLFLVKPLLTGQPSMMNGRKKKKENVGSGSGCKQNVMRCTIRGWHLNDFLSFARDGHYILLFYFQPAHSLSYHTNMGLGMMYKHKRFVVWRGGGGGWQWFFWWWLELKRCFITKQHSHYIDNIVI